MEMYQYPAHHLHQLLRNGEVSSEEITESVFHRIDQIESKVNAFIALMKTSAVGQARKADQMISRGEMGAFTGIPLGIKDGICLKGAPTTCGSNMLRSYRSPYDATVIEKLRGIGAVFVGKTNMDEFAMGSSNETSCFGPTKNPWNLAYVPGGSSGGSAAATAARECVASLGSDTGGSIRQPASHCGVVGLKPTYGRVSRYGLVAFASSLDQIGPMANDVRDCALLLQVISGHDPNDSTSVDREVPDYGASLGKDINGLRVGLPKEYFGNGLDPDVRQTINEAARDLTALGAQTMEVSLPHTEHGVAVYYIIAPAEASSNLARFDGVRYGLRAQEDYDLIGMLSKTRAEGFGPEVIRRIMLGTFALSEGYYDAYYKKASQVRTLLIRDFREAFKTCDILLTPVAPTPAFRIREKTEDPLTMYLSDIFTLSASLAGIPGISLPYGLSRKGLPIGVQLLGNYFDEEAILKAAFALEQQRSGWEGKLPVPA
jgi:aspartyl-tRNA(Asn)/glutamyl-tRNA(Gln) amidotransferase subunit A